MKKIIISILIYSLSLSIFAANYKIGILAKDGIKRCLQDWEATESYLNDKIPEHKCDIVPLLFEEIFPAIEKKEIDFFLTNSSMFVTSKIKYDTKEIATIINSRQGKSLKYFGGVIFTSAKNKDINTLNDLKGKVFAAVSPTSFGGWQMAYKEFLENGIDPFKEFKEISWAEKHEFSIMKVIIGEADAATARTDTIEKMRDRGIIKLNELKILNNKNYPDFPFVVSTKLYPEWPIARLNSTDKNLSEKVARALKRMTQNDKAAKSAKIIGWMDPLDYSIVEELQKTLKIEAYKQ